jgi:pimeloyl-ACP methyl ester carboxylesterase
MTDARRVGCPPQSAARGHTHLPSEAGSRRTVEIDGASHVVGVSHPAEVADLVLEATRDHAAVPS